MANTARVKYRMSFTPARADKSYKADCSCIGFVNQGTATAIINELVLPPGTSFFAPDSNPNEFDDTDYFIKFDTTTGTNKLLVIVRKSYM